MAYPRNYLPPEFQWDTEPDPLVPQESLPDQFISAQGADPAAYKAAQAQAQQDAFAQEAPGLQGNVANGSIPPEMQFEPDVITRTPDINNPALVTVGQNQMNQEIPPGAFSGQAEHDALINAGTRRSQDYVMDDRARRANELFAEADKSNAPAVPLQPLPDSPQIQPYKGQSALSAPDPTGTGQASSVGNAPVVTMGNPTVVNPLPKPEGPAAPQEGPPAPGVPVPPGQSESPGTGMPAPAAPVATTEPAAPDQAVPVTTTPLPDEFQFHETRTPEEVAADKASGLDEAIKNQEEADQHKAWAVGKVAQRKQENADKQQALVEQNRQNYVDRQKKIEAATKAYQDASVDPKHWAKSQSFVSKVLNVFGAMVGGYIGAYHGGENKFLEFINGQIKDTIDADKSNQAASGNVLAQIRAQVGDENAADSIYEAGQKNMLADELDAYGQSFQSGIMQDEAKSHADQLRAGALAAKRTADLALIKAQDEHAKSMAETNKYNAEANKLGRVGTGVGQGGPRLDTNDGVKYTWRKGTDATTRKELRSDEDVLDGIGMMKAKYDEITQYGKNPDKWDNYLGTSDGVAWFDSVNSIMMPTINVALGQGAMAGHEEELRKLNLVDIHSWASANYKKNMEALHGTEQFFSIHANNILRDATDYGDSEHGNENLVRDVTNHQWRLPPKGKTGVYADTKDPSTSIAYITKSKPVEGFIKKDGSFDLDKMKQQQGGIFGYVVGADGEVRHVDFQNATNRQDLIEKRIRMATPEEIAGATEKKEAIKEKKAPGQDHGKPLHGNPYIRVPNK